MEVVKDEPKLMLKFSITIVLTKTEVELPIRGRGRKVTKMAESSMELETKPEIKKSGEHAVLTYTGNKQKKRWKIRNQGFRNSRHNLTKTNI